MSNFPRTVEEITPNWLTQVLRESGAISEAEVESFNAVKVGDEQGVASDVNRLQINYNREVSGCPRSIIAKTARIDLLTRSDLPMVDGRPIAAQINEREVGFYRELAQTSNVRTPKIFFAEYDPDSYLFLLLQEDLGELREAEQSEYLTDDDAIRALRAVAALHARHWGSPDLERYSWLRKIPFPAPPEVVAELFPGEFEKLHDLAGEYLPSGLDRLAEKLAPNIEQLAQAVTSHPVTLTHGDFKLANLFFDDSKSGVDSVVFFDWQLASNDRAANDVAAFIMQSAPGAEGIAQGRRLLAEYHEALISYGVSDYSLEELTQDVRVSMLPRFINRTGMVVRIGDRMMATKDGRRRMMSLVAQFQTLLDWNCDEVIPK